MKKFLPILILLFLFIRFLPSLSTYSVPFDKKYWYDRYYKSQWVVPQSKNPIDDAGLYKVAGYDLATTHTFFKINPEAPPLGKYIYGYSILLFNNAEVASLLMYIISILLFYYLSSLWFKDSYLPAIATILLILDPLVFEHAHDTLLDLPQLIAILVHGVAFFHLITLFSKKSNFKKELPFLILAGVSLGIFISVKFAFLAAVIVLVDTIILFKYKKFLHIVWIGLLSILIYFGAYGMYFVHGHSIHQFLGDQKWILTFYLDSKVIPVYGTVFTTLLIGTTKGWHEGAVWERVKEWNILWSIYLVATLIFGIQFLMSKKKSDYSLYLLLLIGGLLAAYVYLPFFTRYLIILIPFMILLTLKLIEYYVPVFNSKPVKAKN